MPQTFRHLEHNGFKAVEIPYLAVREFYDVIAHFPQPIDAGAIGIELQGTAVVEAAMIFDIEL